MSQSDIQNPFAPPRAIVADKQIEAASGIVLATRMSRLLAVIVDSLPSFAIMIVGGITWAVTVGLHATPAAGDLFPAGAGAVIAVAVIGFLAYAGWNIYLVYSFGQTFGKRVMGIRVVRTDGSRATFKRIVFMRWGILVVVSFIPAVGSIMTLVDPLMIFRDSRQCLHDNVADTLVATAESSSSATLAGSRAPRYA